ncbi:MAG: pilus assembly protein [Sphingomonas sp.]|nr:pilus assembly protein [Sphingomonas sp.]
MRFTRKLAADRAGSTAVEFAVAVPILVTLIWGIFQVAILYRANAGMQHALGEGARLATIFPTPGDEDIQAKITSHKFGVDGGTWSTPSITTDTVAQTKSITVTYSQPTDFLFFQGPTVSLTRSKLVYLST